MTSDIRPAPDDVVEAFAVLLIETRCSNLELADVLHAWDTADPGWASTTSARLRLADALARLETSGLVQLPSRSGTRWDHALPPLPTRIAIPMNRRPFRRALDPSAEPWVPTLDWAATWIRTYKPPHRHRIALAAVNRWLAASTGRRPPTICREERSLEVFDNEKTLASLVGTPLFEPERLSLELLACEAPIGGIRIARLTSSGPVLVMENKAAFDSAWRALHGDLVARGGCGYAAVAFGGGDQAASLVRDLRVLDRLIGVKATRFDYAGDIDVAGISAAAAFIDTARAAGLDAGPASELWQVLGGKAPSGDDLTGDAVERDTALVEITRLGLPDVAGARLREGVRVPQERLDRTAMSDTTWWARGG